MRTRRFGMAAALLAIIVLPAAAGADDNASADSSPGQALKNYVGKADGSFRWVKRREGQLGSASFAELTLTSQTWKGIPWKHQLFIIKPQNVDNHKQGVLLIAGGRWRPEYSGPADPAKDRLPKEAVLLANAANLMKSPVAVLLQVPQQPIFDGKVEDQIIAYTFEQFLRTRDSEWPLLLPMVKSAVRGMDATQQFVEQEWKLRIQNFTVTGASKRGWTTWLTGAVEPRATAIAPMVIDVLNMPAQMKHQLKAWGKYSDQIDDYTRRGIQKHMQTAAGEALNAIVDPFSYRTALTQPKLLLIGTNDRYWPLDALNLYWKDLSGDKYVTYVPNNGHGLNDISRVVGSVMALHRAAAGEIKLPKLDWKLDDANDALRVSVSSDQPPNDVVVWVATSPTRDFRDASWRSQRAAKRDGVWRFEMPHPASGFAGVFGEAVFGEGANRYFLSTNVMIGAARPAPGGGS